MLVMQYKFRDLRYLKILAKSMDVMNDSFSEDRKIFLLHHLLLSGEIVSKGKRMKLSVPALALIPKNACELLQNIRDDFISHLI